MILAADVNVSEMFAALIRYAENRGRMIPETLTIYETKRAITQKITSNTSDVATTSVAFRVLVTNVYLRQLHTSQFSTRLLRKHNLFSVQQIVTFWWRAVLSPRTERKTQSQHAAVNNIKSLTKQWTQQFFHEQYKYTTHKKHITTFTTNTTREPPGERNDQPLPYAPA